MEREELKKRIEEFIEQEARACSMEPSLVTPEYICRIWGGAVPLEEIREAMK